MRYTAGESTKLHARRHNFGLPAGLIRQFYGEDRVANVATFRTEKSKSAILTAARGLGIDVDIAQYIASLIPAAIVVLQRQF